MSGVGPWEGALRWRYGVAPTPWRERTIVGAFLVVVRDEVVARR